MIPEEQLLEMISKKKDVETVVTNLIENLNTIGIANGGYHDNMTAALVEMETDSKLEVM